MTAKSIGKERAIYNDKLQLHSKHLNNARLRFFVRTYLAFHRLVFCNIRSTFIYLN